MVTICTTRYNIKQFCVLPTQLYLCVLYGSQNKQRLFPYTALTDRFLGAFAKLWKATLTSFVMSVCPSVCILLSSHWTNVHEIWYLSIFRNSVDKIQDSLKSDKNDGTVHEDVCTFSIISRSVLLRRRNESDKICRENQNTLFFCWITFLFQKSYHSGDNVEKYCTAGQVTGDNTAHARFMLET